MWKHDASVAAGERKTEVRFDERSEKTHGFLRSNGVRHFSVHGNFLMGENED